MAQLFYVTTSGVDDAGRDGTNPTSKAWATVQYAVDRLAVLGGDNTLMIGPGITNGAARLALDATNDNQAITLRAYGSGASIDNKTGPSTTANATILVGSGCNSGIFRFFGLAIVHSHSTTSAVVSNTNASATDLNFEFTNCTITSSHNVVQHTAAGVVSYTFTGCTAEYGVNFTLSSQNGCTFIVDSTAINSNKTGQNVIYKTGGTITALTIRNGSTLESSTSNYRIIDTSVVGDLTLTDSTFNHNNAGVSSIVSYANNATEITDCIFNDAAGVLGSGVSLINLRNGAAGCDFSRNKVTGISSSATSEQFAVWIASTVSGGAIITNDNDITTGCGGIYFRSPTVSGTPGGECSRNKITITSSAASACADGINIGGSSESPDQTWGTWKVNDNQVTFTGTNAGIGIRLSVAVQGENNEFARNKLIGQTSPTTGNQYGFYFQARNSHVHHNQVYSRDAMAMISSDSNLAEFNDFVSPTAGAKGVFTLNYHAALGNPTDTILRNNIICALFNVDGDYALDVEGTPSDIFVDRNWYGVADRSLVELNNINGVGESATIAQSQSNWNSLGGDSVGSDLNSVLATSDVFRDPASGDFSFKASALPALRALGFQVGANPIPPAESGFGVGVGLGVKV